MPLEKLGPYKLDKLLGRGGMGAVYVGLNEQTGERAAVKVLSGHLADDESFRERFKIEVETLKRLLHPNIVQLFGYGEEDGHLFYVMELVEGRSLQDELAAGRRFTWREVARIGIAVAQALKHAHDRGIIHRDLKPANLLIDAQDHVKLTDFGIAKLYGGANVTADGGVLGTADFMAPEQAEGRQITSRCDLYALGSVLYALLTGRPPFAGRTLVQVIEALRKEPPVPVRRLAPDTPEAFEDIIQQLLEKDPQKRIPTALALSNRLKAMEHALSLETRVVGQDIDEPDESDVALSPEGVDPAPNQSADRLPPPAATGPLTVDPHGKTTGIPRTSLATQPLAGPAADEYRLAHAPTLAEPSSGGPSDRTALRTQAGTPTGSDHGQGTAAVGRKTAAADDIAKATRFITVSPDELRGERAATDDTSLKQWLIVGVLAVVAAGLIGITIFWATRAPTADELFERVAKAADSEGTEGLAAVEGDVERFLELYPSDPRAEQARSWKDELELERLERSFERRARRTGGVEGLLPIERAYLEAVQQSAHDPEGALAKLHALVAVFGGPSDPSASPQEQRARQQNLDLARRRIEHLSKSVERLTQQQRQAVRRELARAEALAATDWGSAQAIWEGIVTLYGDKAWAADLVAEAQQKAGMQGP